MSKSYDATLRKLIEMEPVAWLRFLHIPIADPARVRVIDSNLSTVTAEADKVLWVDDPEPWIEHLELQAGRNPDLPERVHWYSTIIRHSFQVPVHSTVILLRPVVDGPELTGIFEQKDRHGDVYDIFRYNVVRVWEQPVEEILAAGLPVLPLAPVSNVAADRVPGVLLAMSERMAQETSREQAATLWSATRILMGLRYDEEQVEAIIEGSRRCCTGSKGSRNRRSIRGSSARARRRVVPRAATPVAPRAVLRGSSRAFSRRRGRPCYAWAASS
jgi:hypothetical protein